MASLPAADSIDINKVIIYNPVGYHYECIESVIHFLPKILAGKKLAPTPEIILNILPNDRGFVKYITTYTARLLARYSLGSIQLVSVVGENGQPQIIMPSSGSDARIILTIPGESTIKKIDVYKQPYTYLISHYYLHARPKPPNILYLAPHCGNPAQYFIPVVLPFSPESVSYKDKPLRVADHGALNLLVQGGINRRSTRELRLLCELVKIGNQKAKQANSPPINLYIATRNKQFAYPIHPNIIVKINKDFWEFNQIAAQCDIILPLVSKKTQPCYYNAKLTSSISYGLGYHMKFIIDAELAGIYNLDIASCHTYSSLYEFRGKLIAVFKTHIAQPKTN
jgi:hypothetical protein